MYVYTEDPFEASRCGRHRGSWFTLAENRLVVSISFMRPLFQVRTELYEVMELLSPRSEAPENPGPNVSDTQWKAVLLTLSASSGLPQLCAMYSLDITVHTVLLYLYMMPRLSPSQISKRLIFNHSLVLVEKRNENSWILNIGETFLLQKIAR